MTHMHAVQNNLVNGGEMAQAIRGMMAAEDPASPTKKGSQSRKKRDPQDSQQSEDQPVDRLTVKQRGDREKNLQASNLGALILGAV